MTTPDRARVLKQFESARTDADALLRSLLEAKAQSEKHLADLKQADAMKTATGRSSIDNAIASTRRMLDTLDRNIAELKREEP